MDDLLDDFKHLNKPLSLDEGAIRFEGLVPYVLLEGTVVAEVCKLLDKANITYEIENPSIKGNATGVTSALHDLSVLLHVSEEDKSQINKLIADYEEQNKGQESPTANPLKTFLLAVVCFIIFITVVGLLYLV